jgi:AcrR family transcriptional regulator
LSSVPPRARSNAARRPLTRERVLAEALALADDGGIESLTMRRLGDALGVEAMSLYNHVEGKDDVLRGIIDLVLAEVEVPEPGQDWAAAARTHAISLHDALQRHRWAPALLMSPAHVTPARVDHVEALLRLLREAGLSPDQAYHAYHVLAGHINGFSLWESGHAATSDELAAAGEDVVRRIPLQEYPYVAEHYEQHVSGGPGDGVRAFELALDLILDGLERSMKPAKPKPATRRRSRSRD